jgi:hypothetical protein
MSFLIISYVLFSIKSENKREYRFSLEAGSRG